jgi:hypothetical protein
VLDRHRPGQVAVGEGPPVAHVDHPLAGEHGVGHLLGRDRAARRRGDPAASRAVERRHVGVVRRHRPLARDQPCHELLALGGEGVVRDQLMAQRDPGPLAAGGGRPAGAAAAEAVGGQQLGGGGQGGEPSGRGPLLASQGDRVLGADEVGAADGAVQQAAPGEHGAVATRAGDVEGLVVVGVAGGVEHLDPEAAHGEDVAVPDADAGHREVLVGGDEVVRRVPPGQQRGPSGCRGGGPRR